MVVVVVVVVLRVVVVVVVDVRDAVVEVVVVVGVVVDVVVVVDDESDRRGEAEVLVAVEPADCEAGGIGSTAPNSEGSRSGGSWSSMPRANNVQAIAPTTAPTASRPCPCCRVDPMWCPSGESSDHW
ncbi:hypothetical protein [Actinophytocola sp.]|uniref:hypothetical protein n=1 Tax=Actinophytocola sp. TaxID=1872138 RepID=UPI003899F492